MMGAKIRDPGGRGVKARLLLFHDAEAKFKAFVATYPTPADYRDTLLGFYVPIFNATNGVCRRCVECGAKFALRTPEQVKRSRHCSDECRERARKRGKERIGNGRSAAENAARRFGERFKRHVKGCPRCGAGTFCPTGESLLTMSMSDALDRFRGDLPSE